MQALIRLFERAGKRHAIARDTFPADTLAAIRALIAEGETHHRAHIRVIIDTAPCYVTQRSQRAGKTPQAKQSARARAAQLFAEHRIWDTEHNCGVLLYINPTDRKVEIVADRDVNRALSRDQWDQVCIAMTSGFRRGEFHESVTAAMHTLNVMLREHYPRATSPFGPLGSSN